MIKSSHILVLKCLVGALALSGVGASFAEAQEMDKKLKRQISVMERVLDEVLLESPNLLVHSREITRGLYLHEFGVIFVLEASLVHDHDWEGFRWPGDVRIERKDGNIIIIRPDKDEDKEETGEEGQDEENEMTWEESREEAQKELYEAGKKELIEALLDYGETLTGLQNDQWVGVAAFFRDSDFFMTAKISRLVIKAKMKDLRDHASGRLSRDALAQKVGVEEY